MRYMCDVIILCVGVFMYICHESVGLPGIGMMVRVFANARETWVQSQVKSYQRLKKWYLMPPCFNTQHYKVWIKGKVEQSRERSSTLPYTLM